MNGLGTPLAGGQESFDQSAESEPPDLSVRAAGWFLTAFGGALFLVGVITLFVHPGWLAYASDRLPVGLTTLIVGAAMLSLPIVMKFTSDPLTTITLDDARLEARYRSGKTRAVAWADPKLSGSLSHAVDVAPQGPLPPDFGWVFTILDSQHRISTAVTLPTGDAIVARVRRLGLPIASGALPWVKRSGKSTELVLIRFARSGDVGLPKQARPIPI
jgi:hypothetical protein